MDDQGFMPLILLHSIFHGCKPPGLMWIWRRVTFKICHGLNGRFHFDAMFLRCILTHVAPLAEPAIRAYAFLFKNWINNNSILSHPYGKVIVITGARAKSLSHTIIHEP